MYMFKTLILIFSILLSTTSQHIYSAESPKYLDFARQMQEHIHPDNNSYQHHHFEVEWKGIDGSDKYVCRTNCSGFITALLKRTYGYDKEDLKAWLGRAHPRARSYYEAIINKHGFERITQIRSVLPGDFISINYPPGTNDASHDTGHIMMVNEVPVLLDSTPPLVDNTQQWSVGIIDCSHTGHGKTDTRYFDNKFHGGVGKGKFRIYTDNQGELVGYSWSTERSSTYYNDETRPLAIGRLNQILRSK